ncbi:restriction endonuclease subunit S [Bifidobacterium adolescentis]|uniref:restriction endonuclease subunit S n=1 Tax=Bifidobacterium adolescentis TaxID=1680 RepID=UPI0034A12CA7
MAEQHEKALVPQIRFAGFTDPWEQRKLGELFEESDERASDREILSVSVANGIYPASESDRETNPGASLANYKVVHSGDVVYNSMRMWQGAVDASRYDGIVSPAYVVAKPNSEVYARFFARLLRQPMLLKQYQQVSQGNSKDTQVLKFDDFASIEISMPASENEQRQIGAFFDRLDSLITLHQRKYDKLCVLKKSMLDKMFPKGGSLYPEIRFAGFTDPWEQRKLGDVATIVGGGTPSTNNDAYWDGDIDWYSPAELGEQVYADRSVRRITQAGYDSCSATLLPAGKTILFTSRAGIGNTAILRRSACTNQGFQSLVVNDDTDVYFVYSMTDRIKNFAEQKASGSTFLEISGKGLAAGEFAFPSKDEQTAIGSMFKQLDHLITLHQRKLELLRNIKKSMLDKMFV